MRVFRFILSTILFVDLLPDDLPFHSAGHPSDPMV